MAVNDADAGPAGRLGQVLEQDGGHAPAAVGVVDEERHLGLGPQRPAVVAGDADHHVVAQGDERHAVDVVDVGEVADLVVGQPRMGREVAEVDALGRLPLVEVDDAGAVVGTDRPDAHGAAVGQHDVGVPLGRVAVREGHLTVSSHVVHPAEANGAPGWRGSPRAVPLRQRRPPGALTVCACAAGCARRKERSPGEAHPHIPHRARSGVGADARLRRSRPENSLLAGGGTGPSEPATPTTPGCRRPGGRGRRPYWPETYPESTASAFEPLAGFYPYGPDTAPPPCGSPRPSTSDRRQRLLLPGRRHHRLGRVLADAPLNQEFGAFTVAIVIAHEFGHAVQDRFVTFDRTVDLELQADCFAGAWTGGSPTARPRASPPGHRPRQDGGGHDRHPRRARHPARRPLRARQRLRPLTAFQDGYENGAVKCEEYADENEDRSTAEIEALDFDTGGDLPVEAWDVRATRHLRTGRARPERLLRLAVRRAGRPSWTPVDDLVVADPSSDEVTCGGDTLEGDELEYAAVYCEDENIAVIDGTDLADDLYSTATSPWPASWPRSGPWRPRPSWGADSDEADLQADCLTAFGRRRPSPASRTSPPERPEDLRRRPRRGHPGLPRLRHAARTRTVFERTSALRTGVFEGIAGCEEYGPLG